MFDDRKRTDLYRWYHLHLKMFLRDRSEPQVQANVDINHSHGSYMEDPPISNYIAPRDFPDSLPAIPPTADEIYQLLELWSNITDINSLRAEDWDGTVRSEYMLWTTANRQQFRVIWNSEQETFEIAKRTQPL